MKLNQVLGIEKSAKNKAENALTAAHHAAQKPALFDGFTKKYKPLFEDGEKFPDQNKVIEMRADNMVAEVSAVLADALNLAATKDTGNMTAKADVVVDGVVLAKDVPATFLLSLEKKLVDLRTFCQKLPVLSASESWTFDANSLISKSAVTETLKTKKVQKGIVLHPPTDKHPAQTQLITDDMNVGTWEEVKMSAALPLPERQKLVEKADKLLRAVKIAREEANAVSVTMSTVGSSVMNYLFNK